jgi:hypothetical protein
MTFCVFLEINFMGRCKKKLLIIDYGEKKVEHNFFFGTMGKKNKKQKATIY